jgi:hypothetical protein
MSTFEVGEVAIFHDPGMPRHGREVTVISALQYGEIVLNDGTMIWAWAYSIESPGDEACASYCAMPENLRKRRPPQDWQQLCRLDEVPSDCVREREVVA